MSADDAQGASRDTFVADVGAAERTRGAQLPRTRLMAKCARAVSVAVLGGLVAFCASSHDMSEGGEGFWGGGYQVSEVSDGQIPAAIARDTEVEVVQTEVTALQAENTSQQAEIATLSP